MPPSEPANGEEPGRAAAHARSLRAGLSDPRLIGGVADITAMIAGQLDDGASAGEVMPVIRDTARRWLEHQVRAGVLPASAGGTLEDLATAVHDQRYGLGPLSAYLRDPQVENVDVNGCDRVWVTYASGERVAGPPVAASDDALMSMIRTWATRGGQTARDFSAAAPLVNVALTGSARMTATMSVTPRPCVSLRRHGQVDITLGRLVQLGSIDPALAAFLSAAVKSRCNIIVTGAVNSGKSTITGPLRSPLPGCLVVETDVILHVAVLGWDTWRNTWLQLSHAAALGGQTTVLTGSLTPDQLERLPARKLIGPIHFALLDCADDVLAGRPWARPAWRNSSSEAKIIEHQRFAAWLRARITPSFDTSTASAGDVAGRIAAWVQELVPGTQHGAKVGGDQTANAT